MNLYVNFLFTLYRSRIDVFQLFGITDEGFEAIRDSNKVRTHWYLHTLEHFNVGLIIWQIWNQNKTLLRSASSETFVS